MASLPPQFNQPATWTLDYVLQDLPPGEGGRHDYKATGILLNDQGHPDRSKARGKLGKHLSAFANYEGGYIIIGIDDPEGNQPRQLSEGRGVPISLTSNGTKDWLQDICYTATDPVIPGIDVHAIPTSSPGHAVFVIAVPPGQTAFQSFHDQRYYERFGSKSVPIGAQKVLDIIHRPQHPQVAARVHMRKRDGVLEVAFLNIGPKMARYAAIHLELPKAFHFDTLHSPAYHRAGYRVHMVKATSLAEGGRGGDYDPLFPYTQRYFHFRPLEPNAAADGVATTELSADVDVDALGYYHIFADDAPPAHGSFPLAEIIAHAQTFRPAGT